MHLARLLLICLLPLQFAQAQDSKKEEQWAKAVELDSLGKHGPALKILEELAQDDPWACKARVRMSSIQFYVLQQIDEAFNTLATVIAATPDSVRPFLQRSSFYLDLQMPERALQDLEHALPLARTHTDSLGAYLNLSVAYMNRRFFKEALAAVNMALELDPDDFESQFNKAIYLSELDQRDEAEKILLQLYEKDPKNIMLLNNLGFHAQEAGDHEKALPWFQKAFALSENDPVILNNLGYALLMTGQADEALKKVERSIKLNPANSYAYRNLGLVWREKKDVTKACKAFEDAISLGYTKQYGDDVVNWRKEICK
jgi:tetratricopeptide (TPR) repeat protein